MPQPSMAGANLTLLHSLFNQTASGELEWERSGGSIEIPEMTTRVWVDGIGLVITTLNQEPTSVMGGKPGPRETTLTLESPNGARHSMSTPIPNGLLGRLYDTAAEQIQLREKSLGNDSLDAYDGYSL